MGISCATNAQAEMTTTTPSLHNFLICYFRNETHSGMPLCSMIRSLLNEISSND